MAILVTNLGNSAAPDFENNADAASYANASWTPPSADNCIILLWVYNTKATDLGVAGTVSGNSLTWVNQASVGTDPGAQTHRLTCYAAISTGTATAGQTTVSFAGVTQSSIIMQFQQVTGVDLTGGIAGVIIQQPTNSSNSATSLAVNLSAAGSPNNRFAAAIGHGQPEGASAEAGWDELDDMNGTSPGHALMSMWDSDSVADTSPSASWTTAGAAVGIAIEIVAAAVGSTYEESVTLGKSMAVTDVGNLVMRMSATLAKVNTVSDGGSLNMSMAITLNAVKAIAETGLLAMYPSLTLQKIDTLSSSETAVLQAALPLGKGLTVVLFTPSNVSKGTVTVFDFSTSPATVTSFSANQVSTDDSVSSSVETGDS
jgi:hypothetical protein